jgi:integration host factor subunit alpha
MTLNKADITRTLMNRIRFKNRRKGRQQLLFPELDYTGLGKKRATRIIESMFEIMKQELEKGERVRISGFGQFQTRFKWARKGRNPKTGKSIILKSRRIVSFQYASKLRERINMKKKETP